MFFVERRVFDERQQIFQSRVDVDRSVVLVGIGRTIVTGVYGVVGGDGSGPYETIELIVFTHIGTMSKMLHHAVRDKMASVAGCRT